MTNCKHIKTPVAAGSDVYFVPYTETAPPIEVEIYSSIVGCLNYLAWITHYDIAYITSVLSKYLSNPSP